MSHVVGRESELRRIEAFLASEGSGALAIVGEPGIGKTTLWQEGVVLARGSGSTVLVARPTEAERRFGFAGLADLLAEVPEERFSALPAPQRTALDIALLRAASTRPPERRVIATAFHTLLLALAGEERLVCAIDDLHWLDAPSAAVVEFALRRLRDEPIRVLVSLRAQEIERSPPPAVGADSALERLELGPLSVGALHRVLEQALGRSFPRPALVRITEAAGGNPLYAVEIARALDQRGERVGLGRVPVPESLEELVRARIRGLPPPAREALLRAAALARPDADTVDSAALAPAEEAGVIRIDEDGRIQFVHPLFASAVYAVASAARRREAHHAVARLVRDPEEQARHLALAATTPDADLVHELEAAARHARLRGAPDTAAELIELALRRLPADAPTRAALQLELAEHLYLASDFEAARALLEQLRRALDPGNLRARATLTLAQIDYWRSGESAATALAEEALADACDQLLRARCLVEIATFAGTVDLAKAAGASREALRLLENLEEPDPAVVAAALIARVRADLFLGEGFDEETAMRALELEERAPPAVVDTRVVFRLGQWLRYVDNFDGARSRLEQAEQQAREEGDDSSLANILLNRVILETWAGNWVEAAERAEPMLDAFGQRGIGPDTHGLWRAYVDAHAGRIERVRAGAAQADLREPMVSALWSRCLGLAELAVGDTLDADRHLTEALDVLDRVDFREPAIWRVEGDAIEAALAVGDVGRAERLLARFEERAARSRIPWSLAVSARCSGLVLAARGELDAAAAALEHALVEHDRCPMPFERARTLLVHGLVQRRLKRKRSARASLETARTLFCSLGAEPWVARVDDELQRVAVRRSPEALSATELRIAELAAAGLSNPQIAAQVYVSRKTVEANLARVYRKLGIATRAQLDRALRDAALIS